MTTPTKPPRTFFLGTQSVYGKQWTPYRVPPFAGHEYTESGYDFLKEQREGVAAAGVNQFKFKLSNDTCDSYCISPTSPVKNLVQLCQVPEIAVTLADPRFQWYQMWVTTFQAPKIFRKKWTEDLQQAEYNETYAWAVHMLTNYQGTNKVFFVGAWEGDWKLLWASGAKTESGYDLSLVPTDEVLETYITWSKIRQKAIDDAKRDCPFQGVHIFHYIEFNLGDPNFEDHPSMPGTIRPTILNAVVPAVNPDFLSYSSYSRTNAYGKCGKRKFDQEAADKSFWELLDYAESKLAPTSTDFSVLGGLSRRVFIGEFGVGRRQPVETWAPTLCHVVRAAATWGCPFVLQWELYDNDSHQQALFPRHEEAAQTTSSKILLQVFREWHEASRAFVGTNDPSADELRQFAIEWFSARTTV
eukprot:Nitzschia sp. Nitz4//scaffold15_size197535//184131//185372//NITZ4_001612-RA/size197535-processed-gene-0.36-mRNA-1//1//CDS//3329537817//9128//frame0